MIYVFTIRIKAINKEIQSLRWNDEKNEKSLEQFWHLFWNFFPNETNNLEGLIYYVKVIFSIVCVNNILDLFNFLRNQQHIIVTTITKYPLRHEPIKSK